MTPIEKQILENQKAIMFALREVQEEEEYHNLLNKNIEITKYLLKPKKKEEPSCDMREREENFFKKLEEIKEEFAKGKKGERK